MSGRTAIGGHWPAVGGRRRAVSELIARISYPVSCAFLIALCLVAVGCRQSAGGMAGDTPDVTITLMTEPAAPAVGPTRWRVTLHDAGGAPITGAAVTLRGDMTHAGMLPVEAAAAEESDGVYVADAEWTMAGDWIVTVTATLPDGRTATETARFRVETGE